MPMKTDEPFEPSGHVPIAGRSSAQPIRGSAAVAANAPPAARTVRRVCADLPNDFITFPPLGCTPTTTGMPLKLCKDDVPWPEAQARVTPANRRFEWATWFVMVGGAMWVARPIPAGRTHISAGLTI